MKFTGLLNKALILLVVFMFMPLAFGAADFKVAIIDVQRVLENVSSGKRVKQILQEEMEARQKVLQSNQQTLKVKKEDFEKKSLVWSPTKKLEEQKKLEKEFMEFQQMVGQADGDMQRRQVELMQPVLIDIRKTVTDIAQKKNFDLVLEKNASGVLYTASSQDITDTVILEYEKSSAPSVKKDDKKARDKS